MKYTPKTKAVGRETLTALNKKLSQHNTNVSCISIEQYNSPNKCPKFRTCNAPICPLDLNWCKRINRSEDASCYYLIESSKSNAQANFEHGGLGNLYSKVLSVKPEISARYARLNYVMKRAAKSGSRMIRSYLKC